ncbi:LytTR family DNA-binding domain-containing protein [Aquimarina sp. MMG016]|uniref:LytR/AlgR family response regulator transcription factor n=1 Tax=Aquimarina sp. MMG016 TaxID=2822690 RepID=UPI001B3A3865|nr:LytTR family DNA-binding domain-containing protein [Aquimarina sp. MMG016]MBQ4819872.1 response regulator transcription factor [Aquimarina sp. MMG016]
MKITAVIIDDEKKARTLLNTILREYCPQIEDVYNAEDLPSGVELIKKHKPDIVFLDIEMPQYSGLQILEFVNKEDLDFEIVFTTAYSEYAVQAFQFSAIDYLLKPMRPKQVQEAVAKFEKEVKKGQLHDRLQELSKALNTKSFNKIALPMSDGVHFLSLDDIICFKADGMYTRVYSRSEGEMMISRPLKHFEGIMQDKPLFYRPHRSFLINLHYIKQFVKKDGSYIIMENDMSVSISKERREEFLSFVNGI